MFPTTGGGFQANIAELNQNGWICSWDFDPLLALNKAARLRLTGAPKREIISTAEHQTDTEEAITEIETEDRQIDLEKYIAEIETDEDLIG